MTDDERMKLITWLESRAQGSAMPGASRMYKLALDAIRAQPANDPLTLDELRGMDGEPVWVTHKDGSGGRWGIVNSYKGTGMCADLDSYTAYWFDDWCGTIAYRRKPEREGGNL